MWSRGRPRGIHFSLCSSSLKTCSRAPKPAAAPSQAQRSSGRRRTSTSMFWAGQAARSSNIVREKEYLVKSNYRRTLRPYRREQLERLSLATGKMHAARVPRSKLHDLFEAAMELRPAKAQLRAEELFGRLRRRKDVERAPGFVELSRRARPARPVSLVSPQR